VYWFLAMKGRNCFLSLGLKLQTGSDLTFQKLTGNCFFAPADCLGFSLLSFPVLFSFFSFPNLSRRFTDRSSLECPLITAGCSQENLYQEPSHTSCALSGCELWPALLSYRTNLDTFGHFRTHHLLIADLLARARSLVRCLASGLDSFIFSLGSPLDRSGEPRCKF
jgi:hypothetical protein